MHNSHVRKLTIDAGGVDTKSRQQQLAAEKGARSSEVAPSETGTRANNYHVPAMPHLLGHVRWHVLRGWNNSSTLARADGFAAQCPQTAFRHRHVLRISDDGWRALIAAPTRLAARKRVWSPHKAPPETAQCTAHERAAESLANDKRLDNLMVLAAAHGNEAVRHRHFGDLGGAASYHGGVGGDRHLAQVRFSRSKKQAVRKTRARALKERIAARKE